MIQTRLRIDLHGSVGSVVSSDLVVRGDRYPRRAKAHTSLSAADNLSFNPQTVFQLVPGAYNRVVLALSPTAVGLR